ncbi:TraR/DksA family transcriptional regulator [Modicisalibacter zincidurans]|uniref:TraR/DksA C4-type zinc finger protein n=1 Tax=Modicisalibacter zincidurans TaxID=1178777 RepID=A0ABP9RE22_9GAMM|nr:TraR/DksA C4-type zinc finger protein [Halomonas zincidurans]MEA3251703.1 TraR/DksA C4-type zinc finger protein [Pseudomonadota bacterium]
MNHPEIDVESIIAKLHSTRDKLLEESADSTDSRATVMLDQTSVGRLSRMDAMQAQAMAKAEEQRRQVTLRKIRSALARLESGEFGECIDCGEWISLARLQWDPTVLKCIDCAD